MSDLRDLYQEVILDHGKNPRNFGKIEGARSAHGHNPLCGDLVTVYVVVRDGIVEDLKFEGSGCAISTASASMMTQALKGRTVEEVESLFERYHDVVTGRADPAQGTDDLGKLAVFAGVAEFPLRVKCATLSWHTLKAALEQSSEPVTTE
jgi:nitrogen fixation NifU-like protein